MVTDTMIVIRNNFSEKLFIQKEAKKFAAQLRQGAAL